MYLQNSRAMDGVLTPIESAKYIVENGNRITVHEDGVKNVARMVIAS